MSGRRSTALHVCFFLSGAAGLIYQALWTRQLGLSFGHTVYAMTTVLAAFMGGLALGSVIFGRIADRARRPFRLYALLELAIGLYCLVTPWLLAAVRQGYLQVYPLVAAAPLARTTIQFALAVTVLAVPALLMGGTLPVVIRSLTAGSESAGRQVASLYGANTLGAAAGAIAIGYFLLPSIGMSAANHLAVSLNLLVCAFVFLFFRGEAAVTAPPQATPAGPQDAAPSLAWGFAISGAVGMLYELVWFRSLVLVIGSSTYAFSAILVTILVGIALGSFLYPRVSRGGDPRLFAYLQILIGLTAFLLAPLFNALPRFFLFLFEDFQGSHGSAALIQFVIAFTIVLLPSTLMGLTFPAVAGRHRLEPGTIGKVVGRLYAFNTFGAIGGVVLTGFLLIPLLGAQKTLLLGVALNLLVGVGILGMSLPRRGFLLAAASLPVFLALFFYPAWDRRMMAAAVSIYPVAQDSAASGREYFRKIFAEILFFKEGVDSTVSVVRFDNGFRSLLINGKADASNTPTDMITQANLAKIPLLLHPDPRSVAIVGLGSGITAGIVSLFAEPQRIEILELEPAVVEAAAFFSPENLNVLADPRVRLHIDDARSFLDSPGAPLDVIISEPSNPWIAGIGNLFSQDFFQGARGRLAPGGIFCQWLHTYSISPDDLKMIIRTFMAAFPDTTLWYQVGPADLILIGRKEGAPPVRLETITARLHRIPALVQAFGSSMEPAVARLLSTYLLGPEELRSYTGEGARNTDDLPLLEFSAPKSLYRNDFQAIMAELEQLRRRPFPSFLEERDFDTPALREAMEKIRLNDYPPAP